MRLRAMAPFLFLFVALLLGSFSAVKRVPAQLVTPTISGYVYDSETKNPLGGAALTALYGPGRSVAGITDVKGYYNLNMPQEGWCTVYAFKDFTETLGVDYVPGQWAVFVQRGGSYTFNFNLKPGASILVKGSIRFVESAQSARDARFTVVSPDAPLEAPLIRAYGGTTLAVLGLNATHVVVPANTPVWLEVNATVRPQTVLRGGAGPMALPSELQALSNRRISLGSKDDYYELSQGRLLELNVERYFVQLNMKQVETVIGSSFSHLTRMEDLGFLVAAERQDLLKAMDLMNQAIVPFRRQFYDEAYSELRRAYILAAETWNRMSTLSTDAYNSAATLTFFFALTAALMVSLISEGRPLLRLTVRGNRTFMFPLKPVYMVALYALLLAIFYVVFPGCRLIPADQFVSGAVFSLVFTFILARFPGRVDRTKLQEQAVALGRALIVAFSAAYRYMRRRRLRTTLSLITVATLMFSFITLTSFSAGRGLVSSVVGEAKVRVDSLLVRNPGMSSIEAFGLMEPSVLEWLGKKPGVTQIAPKAESLPSLEVLDNLRRLGKTFPVRGIIGVVPDMEANITRLNSIVVKGVYLRPEEPNEAMIGASLAEEMGVDLGIDLYVLGRKLTVVGLFNEKALENLRDVDGAPIGPYFLVMTDMGPMLSPCLGAQVVVTSYETALTMQGVTLSRVDIMGETREKLMDVSQEAALTYEYVGFLSVGGQILRQVVGPYVEETGLAQTFFIIALIALILGNTMFGAVHERRNELAVFSSVGLNPSHISAIFLSEATILGFIGGGLGYLAGLCSYRVLGIAVGGLLVREKASAEWGMAALFVSIMATILGTVIPALRASTIVTPSLLRKWKIESQPDYTKPWVVEMPVKVRARELELFLNYVQQGLARESGTSSRRIFELTEQAIAPKDVEAARRIGFSFHDVNSGRISKNELIISQAEEGYYKATLYSLSDGLNVPLLRQTGSLLRNILFEWNVTSFKVATPVDSLSQVYTLVDAYHPKILYAVTTKGETGGQLRPLRERWLVEGTRVPKTVTVSMNEHDMDDCLSKADQAVSDADVICVTGGPNTVGVAMTLAALKYGKTLCYADDPRSPDERRLKPYETLPLKLFTPPVKTP